jgi:transposase InsO family protein
VLRTAFIGVHPDERAGTTVRFVTDALAFFAGQGVRVERVMTDNAMIDTHSTGLAELFAEHGIRHVRIRPRRPQTNGMGRAVHRDPRPGMGLCPDQLTGNGTLGAI